MERTPTHHRAAALVVSLAAALGLSRACAPPPAVTPPVPSPRSSEADAGPLLLDPNTASPTALERLPGIGPTLARRIAAARDEGLYFERPEDLLRVRGLRPRTLALLREHLVFKPLPPSSSTMNHD